MRKRIKLMAEYFTHPLWILKDGLFSPIDPGELNISEGLVSQLNNWADRYNSKINLDDPRTSAFFSNEELSSFDQEGAHLWRKLINELSSEYDVEYFSAKDRKILRQDN